MKYLLSFIYVLLFFLWAIPAIADKGDTVKGKKSPVTLYGTQQMLDPGNIWFQYGWMKKSAIDTNINNLEIYSSHYNLGNTGLPYVPVNYDNTLQPVGFYYENDYINNNFYSDSTVKYFNTRAPYTRFYYVTDPEIHQYFELTHTENVGKKFNFGIGFKRIRSEGIYLNQSTNLNQLLVTANYHSKRYSFLTDAIYNVQKFNQNGGIKADSFLSSSLYTDRLTVPVNLNYAGTAVDEISFHFKQYYFFGYKYGDSVKASPLFYLSHSFRIAGHSNVYSDNNNADSLFYQTFYHGLITYDSTRYTELTNDISIGTAKGWNSFLRWEAGITQQHIAFRDYVSIPQTDGAFINHEYTDTNFTNYIVHARLYNAFANGKILADVSGQYIFSGNLQGNYQLPVQLGLKVDSLHFFKLSGALSGEAPPFIYDLFHGNNFEWVNHFSPVNTATAGLSFIDNKWHYEIKMGLTQQSNMVYFDTKAQPKQYHPAITVYYASLTKDFKLMWHFHLVVTEKFQSIPNNLPLRLPGLVSENSFFWQNYLFHHALLIKVGADVWYNTAYYGYAYMPEFNQYFLQNSTQLGNYVYVDPFVSFRIKAFRMFLKYENATQGLVPYTYFYALHYPMNDATLRFGISWDFWN